LEDPLSEHACSKRRKRQDNSIPAMQCNAKQACIDDRSTDNESLHATTHVEIPQKKLPVPSIEDSTKNDQIPEQRELSSNRVQMPSEAQSNVKARGAGPSIQQ
jgi:hypothetical protein